MVDTTGAGDAFAGGLLAGLHAGDSILGAVDIAHRAAAETLRLLAEGSRAMNADRLTVSPPVADALAEGRPVVALESTVYSTLGLPEPANREALDRCLAVVEARGAVPAVTALLDGVARVGLDEAGTERVLTGDRKVAARDLPVAIAQRWSVGVTTVSASLALADAAGIGVFATGGIGGVHRDVATSGDVSADLPALARHRIATVCAGAKSFLDLPRTLEHLETLGVPVVGYGTDELPAFWVATSGLPLPHRVDGPAAAADVVRALDATGVVFAAPPPRAVALDPVVVGAAIDEALVEAARAGISGQGSTPFVLEQIAAATDGRTVPTNVALVENNAAIAAEIAVALSA